MFIHVQSLVVILKAIRGPTMLPSDLDGEEQLRFLLEATGLSDAESWTQDEDDVSPVSSRFPTVLFFDG